MKKENITNYLLVTCIILIVSILLKDFNSTDVKPELTDRLNQIEAVVRTKVASSIKQMSQLDEKLENENKKFQVRLDELELNSKRMESSLSDQSTLLHRVVGKVIPIKIPTKITDELNSLAAKLGQRDSWPKEISELDISEAQLTSLLKDVSPWMEEALLPQLNTVRWLLGAHELRLKKHGLEFDEWLDYIDDLETQLSFTPNDSSEELSSHLQEIRFKFSENYEISRKEISRSKAVEILKNTDVKSDILYEIIEELSEWKDLDALTEKISVKAMKIESEEFISSVQRRIELFNAETDESFKKINMGNLGEFLGLIVVQRNELIASGVHSDDPIQKKLKALAQQIEEVIETFSTSVSKDNQSKMRSYQKKALDKIIAFKQAIPKAKITEKGYIWDSEIEDYAKIKNLMISHLLPIDSRMLEPAVGILYNKAFEAGWKILEDEKVLQTEVAKNEAVVQKMKL